MELHEKVLTHVSKAPPNPQWTSRKSLNPTLVQEGVNFTAVDGVVLISTRGSV